MQKYLTVASTVLSDAKRNEIIVKNPARMIDLPDTARRVQLISTDAEAYRFLDVLANEGPLQNFLRSGDLRRVPSGRVLRSEMV